MELSKLDLLIINALVDYPNLPLMRRDQKASVLDIKQYLSTCYNNGWLFKSWLQRMYIRLDFLVAQKLFIVIGDDSKRVTKIYQINSNYYEFIRNKLVCDLLLMDELTNEFGGKMKNGYFKNLAKKKD